jgi:drug/metabolite transporter (DMT)-like permease
VKPRLLLVYVGVAILWGSTWLVVKVGLQDLPPLRFAGVRMLVAGLLLAPIALRGGHWRELAGPARQRVLTIGLFQIALPYAILFTAQQWVPSGVSAVLFATFPIWIALLARFLLPGETLGPLKIASALLGVAGVAVIQLPHLAELERSPWLAVGGALIVVASIVIALANVLVRRHLVVVSPLAMTTGQTLAGGVLLLAVSMVVETGRMGAWTPRAVAALLYLAVFGTGLTYLGLYWLVPRVPIAAIGALPLLDTTVAVALGAAVGGEPLAWHMASGGAMVLVAAWLASRDAPQDVAEARPTLATGTMPGARTS